MSISEYKKLKKIIERAFEKLENIAIETGEDLMSEEYEEVKKKVKEELLKKYGFSVEEYDKIKQGGKKIDKESVYYFLKQLKDKIDNLQIPDTDKISEITRQIIEQELKPPQIINKIERIIEQPKVIERKEIFLDKELLEEIKKDILEIQNELLSPKSHTNLIDIFPDQHHKEKHTLENHLYSDLKQKLKDLTDGGNADHLHRHIISISPTKKAIGGGGSSFSSAEVAASFYWIDLSSQCNSVLQTFALGRTVKSVLIVNLDGTIPTYTSTTTTITLTTAVPDSGQTLKALVIL